MPGTYPSRPAQAALQRTIALARSTGAEVIAVHAFKVPYSAPPATGFALFPNVEVWAESVQRTFVETWRLLLRPEIAAMLLTVGAPTDFLDALTRRSRLACS